MLSEEVKKAMCSIVTIIGYDEETDARFGSGFVIRKGGDASVVISYHLQASRPIQIQ